MNGYVIELRATFAFRGDNYEEALQKIFENIDLNETGWEDSLVAELTEDEFNERFGEDFEEDDDEDDE